jgi:hypothetical protein
MWSGSGGRGHSRARVRACAAVSQAATELNGKGGGVARVKEIGLRLELNLIHFTVHGAKWGMGHLHHWR